MKIEQASATTLAASETIKELSGIISRQIDGHWVKGGEQIDEKFESMLNKVDPYIKKVIDARFKDRDFRDGKITVLNNSSDVELVCQYAIRNSYGEYVGNFSIIILPKSYCFTYDENPVGNSNIDYIKYNSGESVEFNFDESYFFPDLTNKNITINTTINDTNSLSGDKYVYIKDRSGKIILHKTKDTSIMLNNVNVGDELTIIGIVDQEIETSKGKKIVEKRSYGSSRITVLSSKDTYSNTVTLNNLYNLSDGKIDINLQLADETTTSSKDKAIFESDIITKFKITQTNPIFEDKIIEFTGKELKDKNYILSFNNLYVYPDLEECSCSKSDYLYSYNISQVSKFPEETKLRNKSPIELKNNLIERTKKNYKSSLKFLREKIFTTVSLKPVDENGSPMDIKEKKFGFSTNTYELTPNEGSLPTDILTEVDTNTIYVTSKSPDVEVTDRYLSVDLKYNEINELNVGLKKISSSGELTINVTDASDDPTLSVDILQDEQSIEGYPHLEVKFPHKVVLPNGAYTVKVSGSSITNNYSGEALVNIAGKPVTSNIKLESSQKDGTLVISATNEKFLGEPVFNLILQDTETTVESKAVAVMFPYTWKNVKPGSYNLKINASTPEAKYTLKPTKVTVKPGIKNEISVTLEEKITAKSNVTVTLNKTYEEDHKTLKVTLSEVGIGKEDVVKETSSNSVIFENVNPSSYTVKVTCDEDTEYNKHHGKTTLPFVVKEGEPKEVSVEVSKESYGTINANINASSIPDTSLKIEIRENNKNGKLVDSGTINSNDGKYTSKKIPTGVYVIHAEEVVTQEGEKPNYSSTWEKVTVNEGENNEASLEIIGTGNLILKITSDTSMTCRFILKQSDGIAKTEKTQMISDRGTGTVEFENISAGTYDIEILDNKTKKPVSITSENNKGISIKQENYTLEMTISNRGNAVISLLNIDEVVLPSDKNIKFNITMDGPEKINDKGITFPLRKENLKAGKYNTNVVSEKGAYILTKTNVIEVPAGVEFTQLGLEIKKATVGTLTVSTESVEGISKEDVIDITISQEDGSKPITKNTVIGKEVKFSGLTAGDYNVSAVVKDKPFKSNVKKVTIDEKNGIEKTSSLKFSRIEKFSTVKLKVSPSEGSQEMDNAEVNLLIKKESGEEVLHKTYNSLELNGEKTKILLEPGVYIATLSGHDGKNTYVNDSAVKNEIKVAEDEGTIVLFDIKYTSNSKTKRNLSIDINPKIEEPLTVKLDNEVKESNVTQFPLIINDLDQGKTYIVEVSNENYSGEGKAIIKESDDNSIIIELSELNKDITFTQINGPKEQLTGTFNYDLNGKTGFVEGTFESPIKLPIGETVKVEFEEKNMIWSSDGLTTINTSKESSSSITLKRNTSNNNIKLTGYTKESYDIKITYNDVSDPLVKEQSTRSVSADGLLDVTDLLCGNNVKIEIKSEGKVLGSVDSQTLNSTSKEISIQINDTPSGDTGNISLTIEPFEEGMKSSDYVLSLGKGDKFEKRNIEVSSANVLVDGIPVGSYETLTFGNNKYKTEIISEAISISKEAEYKKTITLEHYDPIERPGTIKLTVEGQLPKEPSDFTLNLYEKEDGKAEPWKDKINIGPDTKEPIEILNVDPKYNYIELIFKGKELDYKSNKEKVIINDEEPYEVTLQIKETKPEPEPSKSKYVKTYTLGLTKGKWVLTIEGKQDSEGEVADYKEDKSWKPDYFKVTKEVDGSTPGPDPEQPPKDPGTEPEVKS